MGWRWLGIGWAVAVGGIGWAQGGAPERVADEGYVGSETCRGCHERNFETWHASYHRTMTQRALPGAVEAPFEGRTPVFEGVAWELGREGDAFFVRPVSSGGTALGARRRVVLVTGSHHYQVYWLAAQSEIGMEQLPLVWHLGERRWEPRSSMFLKPPGEAAGVETGRWKATCIKCHATNGTQRHGEDGRTSVAELGIACEACHGPGAEHVARRQAQKASAEDPEAALAALAGGDAITNPADLSHERSAEVCGQCHGIHPLWPQARIDAWRTDGYSYRPGDVLGATRDLLRGHLEDDTADMRSFLEARPEMLASFFWKDGEVRVSGREFNGLVETPCYLKGAMSCLSCHELHPASSDSRPLGQWANDQLAPGMDGPEACLQCHEDYRSPERWRAHTHHAPGTSGSACMDCHMPYTTYGLTKAIRSHRVTSPSVALSLASGRPNACNLCHLDRTLGWTADRLHEWYGQDRPTLSGEQENVAESVRGALAGDAGVRVLWAWHLGWAPARAVSGTGWIEPLVSTLLMDPYAAVRRVAQETLHRDPRYGSWSLDFTAPIVEQQDHVRSSVLTDWLHDGLRATPEQASAVLVRPDGTLDEARFRALFAERDNSDVRLSE